MDIGGSDRSRKKYAARVGQPGQSENLPWRPREILTAVVLFLATAAFVLWQNARVAVLWDLGYLLDTSWRIAGGQMPYRDFPLAHAPLTFLIQAGLIRAGGRLYLLPVAYAAFAGGLATVLTWGIVLRIMRGAAALGRARWLMALALTAPVVVVGIYSVYPHPIYDCDCTLSILLAIFLLVRLEGAGQGTAGQVERTSDCTEEKHPSGAQARHSLSSVWARPKSCQVTRPMTAFSAGAVSVMPLFFKQNIGLPFLAAVAAGGIVLVCAEWMRTRSLHVTIASQATLVLAGTGFALLACAGMIGVTAGVGNYVHWTVGFAAQRRLPGVASMLSVYEQPSFVWTLPTFAAGLILCNTRWITRWWARIAALSLMAAPFAGSLIFLLIDDDADERADNLLALWPLLLLAALMMAAFELRRGVTIGRLVPFFAVAAIHGSFLSQQLWGSTYALWPLLTVLIAGMLCGLPMGARAVAIGSAAVMGAAFLVCGGLYSVSLERLRYVQIPDAPVQRSSIPALRGMATPGPFLSNLDELVEFAASQIPQNEAVLPLPGEDPFFYATGRLPQFPVTLFDPATDPYSADGLIEEAHRRDVRWVIVKRALQINENPMPEKERTLQGVERDFVLYRRLQGYDVYRRR